MLDNDSRSCADLYWRDKVQTRISTLAALFITTLLVGTSVATAAGSNVLESLRILCL